VVAEPAAVHPSKREVEVNAAANEVVIRELRGQVAAQEQEIAALQVELHELRSRQGQQAAGLVSMRDQLDTVRQELAILVPDAEVNP
jgi:uncharacterized membrane protein